MVTKGKGDWRENGERKWQGRAVEGRGRSADLGVSATLGALAAREDPRLRGQRGAADPGLLGRDAEHGWSRSSQCRSPSS